MDVDRKAKEAAGTSKMRRFNGQETTSKTVGLHGGRSLGKRREGRGETAAEVPETQPLNLRPSISPAGFRFQFEKK